MSLTAPSDGPAEIAIVGGGIVGLILAAGLHRRSIPVHVYEQSSSFRESGAGIGFNIAAKACMEMIDPAVLTALRLCGGVPVSAADHDDPHDYLRWVDGYSQEPERSAYEHLAREDERELAPGGWQRLYLKADAGYKGIEGTRRDHFLEELGKLFPSDIIHFNKHLDSITDPGDGGRVTLSFADGTTATADAVIGCDGIRSRVRDFVLGPSSPPCRPTYAHVRSYRALLPMGAAAEALGAATASIYHNHVGPAANVIHYPVAQNTLVNIAIFLHDADDWPEALTTWTARDGLRSDIEAALGQWHPRIRRLVEQLPERIPVLGVFDMHDHPLARYHSSTTSSTTTTSGESGGGRIAVAGDAAHASSPHHGAGAGMGIEDALCLSVLMAEVASTVRTSGGGGGGRGVGAPAALAAALRVYDGARRPRSQWLVNSSRRVCELQHSPDFGDPARRVLAETCFEEIMDRTLKIWNFDYMGMVRQSVERYGRAVNALRVKSAK